MLGVPPPRTGHVLLPLVRSSPFGRAKGSPQPTAGAGTGAAGTDAASTGRAVPSSGQSNAGEAAGGTEAGAPAYDGANLAGGARRSRVLQPLWHCFRGWSRAVLPDLRQSRQEPTGRRHQLHVPNGADSVCPRRPAQARGTNLVLIAVGAMALLVAIITAVAVSSRPTINYCHFSCGPRWGHGCSARRRTTTPNLVIGSSTSPPFDVAGQDASSVALEANQNNFLIFDAATGTDVAGALKKSINGLSSNEFQGLQQISSVVPGAEIGFVPGQGEAFSATYVPPGGGQGQTVSIIVMAATQGNMTLSVLAVGNQDLNSVAQLPFGLANGSFFDYEVSNTLWPGQA